MTITLDWWLAPLLVTVASYVLAFSFAPPQRSEWDYSNAIVTVVYLAGATIASLIAWLVWALVR